MGGHLKNTKLLQQIALKLKSLREEKGLTQEDVYNDTGIHISRIETSRINITVSTLSALCCYFEIPISNFFDDLRQF